MKKLYTPTYKSYLATQKRKLIDEIVEFHKAEFRRIMIDRLFGKPND